MSDDTQHNEDEPAEPRAGKPDFLTQTRFDQFELPAAVASGIQDAGFEYCTSIQAQVLPISLQGGDIAGQAQTGTGKTAAFLVTVVSRLLSTPRPANGNPRALILAPTRELAQQIFEEARTLAGHTDLRVLQVVGGVDYRKQSDQLKEGTDIVVCTPGRLIDFQKQRVFRPGDINVVVIDEADRLLDLGFANDIQYILGKLPHYTKRQSMLFSATLSFRVMELTYEYMNLPEFISVTPETMTVEGIEQQLFHVGKEKKFPLLLGLLQREEWSRLLIFANTKVGVDWLARKLRGNGFPAEGITGDLPQQKRFQLMGDFRDGRIRILVATDVASRGIHVEDISHVINYDLPQDPENYIHRIGRTARAGKTGTAISLACERYVFHLEPMEDLLGYKIPVVWAEDDWYAKDGADDIPQGRRRPRTPAARDRRQPSARKAPRQRKDAPRKEERVVKKAKKTFPGAFFGFGPQPDETKSEVTPPETPQPEVMQAETLPPEAPRNDREPAPETAAKKKRRRRRRKPAAPKEAS